MASLTQDNIDQMDAKCALVDQMADDADRLASNMDHFWVGDDAKFRAMENSRNSRKLAGDLRERRNRIVASGSDEDVASFLQGSGALGNGGVSAEAVLQNPINEAETVALDSGHDIAEAAKKFAPFGIAIGGGMLLVIGLVAAAIIFAKVD